jgi:Lrp/AsnC family transcriptional regulator for asnA, asnC and gidA
LKDRKILYELEKNSRQSFSVIGKKVKLPKNVVAYRVKRLMDENLIKGFYPVVDLSKLGLIYCRIFLKFQNISADKERKIIEHLKKIPSIGWLGSQEAYWDLVAVVSVKSLDELYRIYKEIIHLYGKYLQNKEITIATRVHHFKHKFLYPNQDKSSSVVGGQIEKVVDETDLKMIDILTKNARTPLLEIARKLRVSTKTAKSRLKSLVKTGVIKEFRFMLNHKVLGYHYFHVFLYLEKMTKEKENELIGFLGSHPNVLYITEALGRADLEFEVLLKSHNSLYDLLRQLKTNFPENIKGHEAALIYDVHKQLFT